MDFGDLTSYKNIDNYFTLLCEQSRQQVLEELFCDKKQIAQEKANLESELSEAFCFLFSRFDGEGSSGPAGIATRISRLFNIDIAALTSMDKPLRMGYVRDCIGRTVQKQLSLDE